MRQRRGGWIWPVGRDWEKIPKKMVAPICLPEKVIYGWGVGGVL
jgi:hypothetical protein